MSDNAAAFWLGLFFGGFLTLVIAGTLLYKRGVSEVQNHVCQDRSENAKVYYFNEQVMCLNPSNNTMVPLYTNKLPNK